jgi:hypothetical protein
MPWLLGVMPDVNGRATYAHRIAHALPFTVPALAVAAGVLCWPSYCRLAYSLQSIDYSNNPGITGRIPPEMGLLEGLQTARLHEPLVQPHHLAVHGHHKPELQ